MHESLGLNWRKKMLISDDGVSRSSYGGPNSHLSLVEWTDNYLQSRSTSFEWGEFVSLLFALDISTPQGAGLSPSFANLLLAPVIHELFPMSTPSQVEYEFFVDDGLAIVSNLKGVPGLRRNCEILSTQNEQCIKPLFAKVGIIIEDDKSELFHFSKTRSPVADLPPVDLGFPPFTGTTPLRQKGRFFRYLGFYFDMKLTFHQHVQMYANKALGKVTSLPMLGDSSRGLDAKNRRLLYRSCVLPIMTYGAELW